METFLNFLVNNWQYISFGLVVLFELILLIVKRVKVNVKLPNSTLDKVLELVKDAEKVYGSGHGSEKLNYVVERYLQQNEVQKVFENEVRYWISQLVERILESPQKKGESDGV